MQRERKAGRSDASNISFRVCASLYVLMAVEFILLIFLLYCMHDALDERSHKKNTVSDAIQTNDITHVISCTLFTTIAVLLVVCDIVFPLPSHAPLVCSALFSVFLCATVATTLRMNRSLHQIFAVLATLCLTALSVAYIWNSRLPQVWRGVLSAFPIAAMLGFLAGGLWYSPAVGWAEWALGALVFVSIAVSLTARKRS